MPIELHPAWRFDCDECGRENFVRVIVGQFDEQTLEELRTEHGIQPWEAGDWLSMPSSVTCEHCGQHFDVQKDSTN